MYSMSLGAFVTGKRKKETRSQRKRERERDRIFLTDSAIFFYAIFVVCYIETDKHNKKLTTNHEN